MGTAIKRTRTKRGPKGPGRITVQKSGTARAFINGDSYDIAKEDVQEKIGNWEFRAVGTAKKPVFVELTEDESRVRNVRPMEGTYFAQFERLAAREDKPPTIYPIDEYQPEGFKWPIKAHEEFYAILAIVNHKDYEGMELMLRLWYLFDVDEDTEEVFIPHSRSKAFANLLKFMETTGYDLDADTLEVGEPQEILGQLNQILQSRDETFMVSLSNGYVPFDIAGALSLAPEGSV